MRSRNRISVRSRENWSSSPLAEQQYEIALRASGRFHYSRAEAGDIAVQVGTDGTLIRNVVEPVGRRHSTSMARLVSFLP